MAGSGNSFVEWKEEFISQERGHRIVHYFLKECSGESILAIVGTERSVRHMFYVVSEDFVRVYGAENSIHSGFKWRSRREVVDWLTSMLSKQHRQGDWSKSPTHDSPQSLEAVDAQITDFVGLQPETCLLSGQNSDIVWFGDALTCGKQLKHYSAFLRNGTKIAIQSFVFVMAKGQNHYLAYLEDMYEDKRGQKKVKVRWFHHTQEVQGIIPLRNSHPKEVFITPYSQVISAECVDGAAIILSRDHFMDFDYSYSSSGKVHLCFRQFRSNKIKPFDITKLRGYYNQPLICYLNSNVISDMDSMKFGKSKENGEFCDGGSELFVRKQSGFLRFKPSYLNSRNLLSGKRLLQSKQWRKPPFQVDEKIELLSQDSGIRGCWFRCTVVQVTRKQFRVQYDDLHDEDDYGNLEEWVPAFRIAAPDKLGMRCLRRQTIRPSPPPCEKSDLCFAIGVAVDAWWSDGWWEGIVVGSSDSLDKPVRIYFPGENFFLNVHQKDVRISRDWVESSWIDVPQKYDILSAVSDSSNPEIKLEEQLDTVKELSENDQTPSSDDPCEETNKFCQENGTNPVLESSRVAEMDVCEADCRTTEVMTVS